MTYQGEYSPGPIGSEDNGRSDVAKQEASQVAGTMKEQGQAVTGAAQQGGQRVVAEAKEQVGQLSQQAQVHFQKMLETSQEEFSGRASEQTDRAAANLHRMAAELHALAEGRTQDAPRLVDYVRQAGDRVEQYASRLDRGGFSGVASDVSGFARRRPGLFLLTAVAAGFAAGRMARGAQAVSGNGAPSQSSLRPSEGSVSPALPTGPAGPDLEYPAPVEDDLGGAPINNPGAWAGSDPLEEVFPPAHVANDPGASAGPGVR